MENIFETLGGILQPDKNNTMGTKHTKGEWSIFQKPLPTHENIFHIVSTAGNNNENHEIALIVGIDKGEDYFNAKLIAAAPDLLEALEDLVYTATQLWNKEKPLKDYGAMTVTHPMIENAKEAIKKATL